MFVSSLGAGDRGWGGGGRGGEEMQSAYDGF